MTFELIQSILYFLAGGFLIFLAVTIARDNLNNRLNRTFGAALLFAGIGPLCMAFGLLIDPATALVVNFKGSTTYNLHYIWEFFFPLLLLFSWIFPEDRLKKFKYSRIRYFIFIPQLMHLIILLFGINFITFLNSMQISSGAEGFSALILKPFSMLIGIMTLFIGFIINSHALIFSTFNIFFILVTIYFLESGKKLVSNPRIITQTKVINWAIRSSLGTYIVATIGSALFPTYFTETISSLLIIAAVLSGTSLLVYVTLRYQFLDVRLAFRQSFVYSITSAFFVGLYVVLFLQTQEFFVPIFGEKANIINYVIIGLLLLLFQPINNWIDEFTRSIFMRTQTDHRNVIERFSRQVISLFDPIKLRQIIEETLKTTLLVEHIYFVLYDDILNEYVLYLNREHTQKIVLSRDDILLRGINQLDSPTFYQSLGDYTQNSDLANELEAYQIKIILPMKDSEHLLGFLALTSKAAGYNYSAEDLNLLGVLSNQMVSALTNARLYVDSLERMRLQEEVSMAREIQLNLLPSSPPLHPCMEISAHSTPSRTIGGDFYDFVYKDKHNLGICIADASGKGMPAALMIAQTQAILKSEVNNGTPIDMMLRNMNKQLVESSSSEKYVTLFYGELNTEKGYFHFSNAGHNYPLLVRANGDKELLKTGGPIIGALPDMSYQSETVKLFKDDTLFFFTDGLSEAMNEQEVEYSEERIHEFVTINKTKAPGELIDSILKDVRVHDTTYPPRDDTTIVSIKIRNGFANG